MSDTEEWSSAINGWVAHYWPAANVERDGMRTTICGSKLVKPDWFHDDGSRRCARCQARRARAIRRWGDDE